ncbi:Twin-arginine translocation protein TatB [Cronobacter condimenti 1330]|uniref:Sec-independent protein translocase protein TatB n=1 Tax=Cronobacter condimenti 1330 TaxID=1073999 RepID=K7ZZY0_9ENTR|nr:Sec-independent protein translocase protein TatB [Cronobacter condimenti]ALB61273.1 preprotein translocase [Cronobacter condimenti 1330]CCJ72381.1 Twin-arginine translocation protein TatB [Cronobacter condimenti 1330]
MFDIGFGELLLVFVIGLIVLGPQRLPVAVRTVAGWVRALRSLATTVQNELTQELKIQEFQESLKKVEKASIDNLTPELKASMDELREAAESMKRSYNVNDPEKASDEAHTIHNPLVKGNEASHEGVTPAKAEHQAQSPVQAPEDNESSLAGSDTASAHAEAGKIVEPSPDAAAPAGARKPEAASTVSDKS